MVRVLSTAKRTRAGALTFLVACALGFGADRAAAHDVLVSTQPAAGSVVHSGPREVRLVFDEPVQSGFADVEVSGPGGAHWAAGPPAIDGGTVTTPLRPLGPKGTYTVRYRIVSADGHPVSGRITFTLTVPGEPAAGPVGGGTPPGWLWLGGATVLAIALGLALAQRLGRDPPGLSGE